MVDTDAREESRRFEPNCPKCGQPLEKITYPSNSMLNRYQWEASVAGDYFCKCHNNNRGNEPYAYYWKRELMKAAEYQRKQAPSDALIKSIEDYRSGYSAGYSAAENGLPMRDKDAACLFFNVKGIPDCQLDQGAGAQAQAAQSEEKEFQNETRMVMFRAGLIACREYMARFVESESPSIAASIRANWWPSLGPNPGPPRKLRFDEVTDGGELGPWPEKKIEPSVEALPVAEAFLVHFGAPVAALEAPNDK